MKPRVVICGSYHRDHTGLSRLFRELEISGCRILSPLSINFEDTSQTIVQTKTEFDMSIGELEQFHLRAIRDADIIWLHAPAGHVGISSAYELGYANALLKPVFCKEDLADKMLQSRATIVDSVFEALDLLKFNL